ncbi:hypothetical protein BXY66_1170 [Shimia isoporae]|uniref:Adenylosuccinate lyase n=1 Tax=Shimia isoporae TaxID=647720 RepID=A0A4R1NLA1_9RHOB|nr:adenylosuccinate lyase [Shimia isoporae]TCL09127.1 hypothetical protein BXY66_1170 [Shimia isoporae]
MTFKSLIIAAALAATPGLTFAMGCGPEHDASACVEGTVWDLAKQRCVNVSSS